ncbi:MAG: addiction module protein [Polaromonas sp.]
MNTITLKEVLALAQRLEPHERADLAAILQATLPPPDPEIERLWAKEALRRLASIDANQKLPSKPD